MPKQVSDAHGIVIRKADHLASVQLELQRSDDSGVSLFSLVTDDHPERTVRVGRGDCLTITTVELK